MIRMDQTVRRLFAPGRGVVAPDEHIDRLARVLGMRSVDAETAGQHRELFLQNAGLDRWISGIVVDAEAFAGASPLADGPVLGVRLGPRTPLYPPGSAQSAVPRSNEVRAQLVSLRDRGAAFVKWRSDLDPMFDSQAAGYVDTAHLALCAAVSQDVGMVPILDIAMPAQRAHSLAVGVAVTANALSSLYAELAAGSVDVGAVVVRMNFVRAGSNHDEQTTPGESAHWTVKVLNERLPAAAPGVMFMSTGLPLEAAVAHLAALRAEAARQGWTRPLTFGFGHALTAPAWAAWRDEGPEKAREVLASACQEASDALELPSP